MPPAKQSSTGYHLLPLSVVLLIAYWMRILQPDIFIIGWDLPRHVVDAMRLHGTSILPGGNENQNFWYQLFVYNHGYTTRALTYFLYEFAFSLLKITITESSLTFVNSTLGIFSLAALYFFFRQNFSRKEALISIAIISITPVHLGLSRVHVGYQIIQLIFFYLSLGLLHKQILCPGKGTKFFYFLTTFLYIGTDNAFPIGLALHLLYIFIHLPQKDVTTTLRALKKIYLSPLTVFFIILPLSIYAFFTYHLIQQHITSGFLLKSVSKKSNIGPILHWPLASFLLVGPIVILFLGGITRFGQIHTTKIYQYAIIHTAIYLLLLCKMDVNATYILYLLPPVTIMAVSQCFRWKTVAVRPKSYVLVTVGIITAALSLSIIYGYNIGVPTMYTYGSQHINQNNGLKTLGYLIRSNSFKITTKYNDHGISIKKLNLYTGFPSAYYYLGTFSYGKPFQYSLSGTEGQKPFTDTDNFLLAKWLTYNPKTYYKGMEPIVAKANTEIDNYVTKHGTPLIGYITDGNRKLIALYSNIKNPKRTNYDINIYDKKFDKEFGKMDSFNFPLTGYELF